MELKIYAICIKNSLYLINSIKFVTSWKQKDKKITYNWTFM
jgi:hypothetical protein